MFYTCLYTHEERQRCNHNPSIHSFIIECVLRATVQGIVKGSGDTAMKKTVKGLNFVYLLSNGRRWKINKCMYTFKKISMTKATKNIKKSWDKE